MTPATASRRVRRVVLGLIPRRPRAWLRRCYESRHAAPRRAAARFLPGPSGPSVHVEGARPFTIPAAARDEFEFHFRNDECAAEAAAFLRAAVSPGLLFDVGANNGLFSVLFCQLHASNRAAGYEPSPAFAARAAAIARRNGLEDRLTIVERAVGDHAGSDMLLLDGQTGRVQAMQFEGTVHDGWAAQPMTVTTLDLEMARLGPPTIVKIDVEGYEWEVLRGATLMLERARPVIMLELHLDFLEQRGIAPAQVTALLSRHGYTLHDLSGGRLSDRRLTRSWASVLHVVALPASA